MATAPTVPLVSVDEYLRTSYQPEMEFVDGVLIEKGAPTIFHGLLQAILIRWFGPLEKEFRSKAVPEVRTQITERARYRIPDLLLFTFPARLGKILTVVPDAVIEILSPEDRQNDNLDSFRDYEQLGIQHIIQMHPEQYVAWRDHDGSLIRTDFHSLSSWTTRPAIPFRRDLRAAPS